MSTTLEFTKEKLDQLEQRYNDAVKEKQRTFSFEDAELLTDYAKYLIQYLRQELKIKK